MDRNTLLRWLVIGGALLIFWKFVLPKITGSDGKGQDLPAETYVNAPDFVPDPIDPPASPDKPNNPAEGELCKIQGENFDATLSSRGGALVHLVLTEAQYASGVAGYDMSTTPDMERWRSLRTQFRGPDAGDQVRFDRFPWKLTKEPGDKGCTFSYEDETVRIEKKVTASTRPYELDVTTTVTNLAEAPKRHRMSIGTYAFRKNSDMKGGFLSRPSPYVTELSCAAGKEVVRKGKDDFKSGSITVAGTDRYAAVNTQYFTQALIPSPGDGAVTDAPTCEILGEEWASSGQSSDDASTVYHAKLVYPAKELAPHASVTYRDTAFFGPKERKTLATAAAGRAKLGDVINLGFFSPVAKFLVGLLVFFHDKITFGNWGLAIILMTICLRLALFPLTFKSIKTTIAMRRLKPEVDSLNEKFKDDAQAKNLAMMELWKKHGVNPFGGCLPQLVQMPVWFAMYTTLQTATEMYHTKFLWFSDMSAPDRFYILPLLLGFFMIVQQRIVPQQGMDPMQQKMMTWLLPGVFTVMMLVLPAALGVYMLTNSILGIAQQLIVERVAPRNDPGGGGGKEIVVKQKGESPKGSGPKSAKLSGGGDLGKGNARV